MTISSMASENLIALMVDDEGEFFYGQRFREAGINLTVAPDSDEALRILDQVHLARLPLDVLMTDNTHPGLRGPELVKHIRNLPDEMTMKGGLRLRHVPIVFHSSSASYAKPIVHEIDPDIPILHKLGCRIEDILETLDKAVRSYRERLLADLHAVGIAITWEPHRYSVFKCFGLDKNAGFETKYIAAPTAQDMSHAEKAYARLMLVQEREWSARRSVQEFEAMLNSPHTKEEDFQHFFRLHPEFLYQNCYVDHWPEPRLRDSITKAVLKPDFVLRSLFLPHRPWSWQIVDLKRHTVPLLASRKFHADFSHHVHRVIAQLRDYAEYFDNPANRGEIESRFGTPIFRPKLVAVIGRLPKSGPLEEYARLRGRILDVSVMTYDEILEFRRAQVDRSSTHSLS